MSRQDKATTERFTRTLRDLVKRPENKVCADCKRNGQFSLASAVRIFIDDSAFQILGGPHGTCALFDILLLSCSDKLLGACFYVFDALGFIVEWAHTSARLNQ